MTYPHQIGLFLLALLSAVLLHKPLFHLALRIGWVDKPDERKNHSGAIPLTGGAMVMLSMGIAALFTSSWSSPTLGLVIGMSILFVVGVIDDKWPLRARYRLAAQFLAAMSAIYFGGATVEYLGQIFSVQIITLGILAAPFTMVSMAGVANAVNMSDGLDGLCGGYVACALFWFLVTALRIEDSVPGFGLFSDVGPLIISALGAVIGFLIFNMRNPWRARAAIFLGDAGSMALGFLLAWLAIRLTGNFNGAELRPMSAVWIIALPLADLAACAIRRVLKGNTPMTADRKHMHHLLLAKGYSVAATCSILLTCAFLLGGFGILTWTVAVPHYFKFWAFMALFALYTVYAIRFWDLQDALDDAQSSTRAPGQAELQRERYSTE